jgi:hypothetical protein
MFWTLLAVAQAYEVLELSSPQVSQQSTSVSILSVLQQSKTLPAVSDFAFLTWAKLQNAQDSVIFSCLSEER